MTFKLDLRILAAGLAAAALSPTAASADRALVVGVNQYPNLKKANLEGCENDARAISAMLRSYGFQVTELIDTQATRKGILTALAAAKAQLQPSERFVFYYAGHGTDSTVEDVAALLPNDARMDSADNDLKAKELYRAVREMPAKSKSVILDSCYSGGMLDGAKALGMPRTRYYSRPLRRDAGARDVVPANDQATNAGISGPGVCYMTAARNNEQAAEDDFPVGNKRERHGLFTYHLLSALKTGGRGTEKQLWRDIQANVTKQVADYSRDIQHPTLSPTYSDLPVFDNVKDPAPPPPVTPVPPPPPPMPKPDSNLADEFNVDAVDRTRLSLAVAPNQTKFKVGDKLSLKVTANVPGYLVVIEKGTSGLIHLQFPEYAESANAPAPTSKDARVEAGRTISVPAGENEFMVADPGTEYVKAFLFTKAEDADAFIKRIPRGGLKRAALSRDFQKVQVPKFKFVTSDLTLEIVDPKAAVKK